jgi:hypothetical protein
MTPDQEFDFYAEPENQELLEQARRAADADDRSLSGWIRRAVEHELRRTA